MYAAIETSTQDLQDLIHRGPLLDETQIQAFFQDATLRHQTLFMIVALVEVVLTILFVITLWFILKSK